MRKEPGRARDARPLRGAAPSDLFDLRVAPSVRHWLPPVLPNGIGGDILVEVGSALPMGELSWFPWAVPTLVELIRLFGEANRRDL